MLPQSLADDLELDALTPVPGSFVDEALAERHTDLLFRTTFRSGATAYVYLLLEHQSEPDPEMPWRMLQYEMRIWQRHRAEFPDARRLPPIIPLVVHHGERGWTVGRQLHDLVDGIDAHPSLRALVPNFSLLIDDLAHRTDAELLARQLGAFAKLALWMLRDARNEERFVSQMGAWQGVLHQVAVVTDVGDAHAILLYVLMVGGRRAFDEMVARLQEENAATKEEAMITAAESFRLEGQAEGKIEGKIEGKREMLRQVAEAKLGPLPEATAAVIAAADEPMLAQLLTRVLAARTISDL